jgi:sugar phosphate isomerase/epimerase
MRFGFNAFDKPPEEYFDYAREHGLGHIEIDLIRAHSAPHTFDDARIERLAATALAADVTLSLHVPYTLDLPSSMPLTRRANIAYLTKCVTLAGRLGAGFMTLHLGRVFGSPIWPGTRHRGLAAVLGVFRKLLPICGRHGVCLALENASAASPHTESAFLGDHVDDFLYLFDKQPVPQLGICFDVGHANTNTGALAFLDSLGDKIIAVHCHDNAGARDQHLAIGAGTVPWAELGAAFGRLGFRGPFLSECFNQPPHEAVACLRKYFTAASGSTAAGER